MASPQLEIGYSIQKTLLLTDEEVVNGAVFLGDRNPIHNDPNAPATKRFGGLIACGPHVSGIHACMLPTHCTALGFDVLGTVFTVRYSAPFRANVSHDLSWVVSAVAPHRSGGSLVNWSGRVACQQTAVVCIEATGQVLVTPQRSHGAAPDRLNERSS